MTSYEKLEAEACEDGVEIIYKKFNSERLKALYCDGMIALNSNLKTDAEKSCILAEELGHYHTSSGDITDYQEVSNKKQELQARIWAYNKKIGLMGIVRAFEHGCKSLYESAEFLEVTEQFLQDALECYRQKYGHMTVIDNYVIYFIPTLGVLKIQ